MDGHTIFDYKVGLNEIVQVIVSQKLKSLPYVASEDPDDNKENKYVNELMNKYLY